MKLRSTIEVHRENLLRSMTNCTTRIELDIITTMLFELEQAIDRDDIEENCNNS